MDIGLVVISIVALVAIVGIVAIFFGEKDVAKEFIDIIRPMFSKSNTNDNTTASLRQPPESK